VAITRADFPLPDTEDTLSAPFYEGAARGELRIPRCDTCGAYVWYPEPACPHDGGALTWTKVSGRGTLFSWVVVRRAFLPAFDDIVPFVTALVALAEDRDVRVPTYIVDADAATLEPDADVEVVFRDLSFSTVPGQSVTVPMFRPVVT
jgi:uncharacterized OB-fold protein